MIYIMAGSLNKVLLIGRLGNDPEIKQMQNGKSVARLSVATSESWKDKNTGEKKEKTEWHRVVIFNEGLVSVVQKYLKKGAQVYIEGQLNTNKYTDSNGQEKYSTQIVLQGYSSSLTMLDGKNSSSGDSKKLEGTQLPSDDMPDISQDPDDKVPF
jgi:single-strand DNA-binding protein